MTLRSSPISDEHMEKTTCSVEDNGLLQGAIVHVSESECTHVTWSRPIVSI